MLQSHTWWRELGAVLAGLVLGLFVFGSSLDGILCDSEARVSDGAAELMAAALAHDEGAPADAPMAACLHGHCHHGGPYIPVFATAAAPRQIPLADRHRLLRERVRISDPKYGLERPPRA